MGQAKLRGSKEERIQQAKERDKKVVITDENIPDIVKQTDLLKGSKPMGYVIYIIEIDKFLSKNSDLLNPRTFTYVHDVDFAKIFGSMEEVSTVAQQVAKSYDATICFLSDTGDDIMMSSVEYVNKIK